MTPKPVVLRPGSMPRILTDVDSTAQIGFLADSVEGSAISISCDSAAPSLIRLRLLLPGLRINGVAPHFQLIPRLERSFCVQLQLEL